MNETVKKESQIESELNQLTEATQILSKLLSEMEERLKPFLRSPFINDDCIGEPNQALVPFAELMKENRYAVRLANSRIKDLLDRLEI